MEVLLFFVTMALFLAFIFIREAIDYKKKEKEFINSLYTDYGRVPDKEYSMERFSRIASYYERHKCEGQIDDITWNDLNLDEIFKRIDYTFSASGEEYLYYTLRNAGKTEGELERLEEVIRFFEEHPDERVKIQFIMNRLGHTGKYSLYDYLDNLDYLGERSNKKHILLNILFLFLIVLIPFWTTVAIMGIVSLTIYNILSYFKEKKEIDPYITSMAYVQRLITISEKLIKINVPVCNEEWDNIRKHRMALQNMRKGSYIVLSTSRGVTAGNPFDVILDYLRMIFHLDLMVFNRMLEQLRQHIGDVDALITQIGYVETAIAIGAFRKSLPEYCVPEHSVSKMELRDAYHPLIEDAIRNSISADKGVLLTGSNASGKSTFLKTVAVNAIFSQTIHTCTAGEYKAPLCQIYSSMSLRDNLESGESYYIVEIKALKRILDAAKRREGNVLCFVDEVLRGTNTVERIAASTQILKSLSGRNTLCFAATHDIELTKLLQNEFDNYHFEEDVRDGDVFFNYRLLPGRATTRNAIKLLEVMGYESEIIEKAALRAERFTESGVWE